MEKTVGVGASTSSMWTRTKHIDVRYHFVREVFEKGKILLQKIPTADNPADMMTKVVTTIKFNHCLNLINILRI